MRIAVDAMGGDNAPLVNIEGALAAVDRYSDLEILLVGDQPVLDDALSVAGFSGDRVRVVPADGFVGMDEKPTDALRRKPKSSIAVCWKLMADREVEAVVSAGNTGGVVAAGLRTRLFLKGVKRPGIAVVLPSVSGQSVLMDVGANPGARPEHLLQYAVMGSIFVREVLGVDSPRIGLMNIGSEDGKGNELVRETHQLLTQSSVEGQYVGNVEGRGLYQGEADLVICEGFVGNVILKVSEGLSSMMMRMIAREVTSALDVERDRAAGAFAEVGKRYEYNEVGGAPLLGIDGICLISHGSSDARSITNALRTAMTLKDRQVNARIVEALGTGLAEPV